MITGKNIGLRAIETEDLAVMRDWRNREHYRKYFREYRELNLENQKDWFNSMYKDPKTQMFGIVDIRNGELIGICGLCYINWVNRFADLSIYIGKDNLYIDPQRGGYAWETLDLLFKYGFDQLNLHKIWSEIYTFDDKKHELFQNYGFHLDGVLRDNYFYDGRYMDGHVFSILAEEWRKNVS
jgi:RimJ/RimL family protein N-acetyltransferase